MKLEHRLLLTGVFALALCANACVQGTVLGGGGGAQDGVGGEANTPGTGGTPGAGVGGAIVTGTGGKIGAGVGGKTGTGGRGTGGVVGAGVGGMIGAGTGGGVDSTCTNNVITTTYPVIDDIEKEGNGATGGPCIYGFWYNYNDGSAGTQTPSPTFMAVAVTGGAPGSTYAIHATATGFKGDTATPPNVFAGVGLDFNTKTFTPPAKKGTVDASAFKGISFYAKGPGMIWVKIPTAISDPDLGCASKCYDTPYKQVTLTAAWAQYQVLWTDLKQDMFGTPETVTGAGIGGIHFENKATAPATASYDIWIDSLRFF